MSTLEPKPVKAKALNQTTLTIAAILLIVLALLFLASPILGLNRGVQRGGNFNRQFNGQNGQVFPGGGTGNGQRFFNQQGQGGTGGGTGNGFPFPGSGTTTTGRQFGGTGLLGLSFLRGTTSIIVYGLALLISLVAVIGMLSLKSWGRVLGIVMAVVYLLLAILSFLPTILFSRFIGFNNPLGLVLNVLHVVLAIAVIVFALLPAKKLPSIPTTIATPPEAAI